MVLRRPRNSSQLASRLPPGCGSASFGPTPKRAGGGLGRADEELGREVALKEMQPQYTDDPRCRTRFLLEATITGGLEHPGIVPVYGLGRYADGRPYYAMRLIKGRTLAAAVRAAAKSTRPGRTRRWN